MRWLDMIQMLKQKYLVETLLLVLLLAAAAYARTLLPDPASIAHAEREFHR